MSESQVTQSFNTTDKICDIVIHKILQKIAHESLPNWQSKNITAQRNFWRKQLIQAGISYHSLDAGVDAVEKAILKTVNDVRGQWILDNHQNAKNELPLTMVQNGKLIHLVIDRTFIFEDKCWIIDYKTIQPDKNESIKNFLNQQKIFYASQFNLYAQAMAKYQNLPIHLGLYFPMFSGWIELNYESLQIEDIKNAS